MTKQTIEQLRAQVRAPILIPSDSGYDGARDIPHFRGQGPHLDATKSNHLVHVRALVLSGRSAVRF
jgi:hypothetical protein